MPFIPKSVRDASAPYGYYIDQANLVYDIAQAGRKLYPVAKDVGKFAKWSNKSELKRRGYNTESKKEKKQISKASKKTIVKKNLKQDKQIKRLQIAVKAGMGRLIKRIIDTNRLTTSVNLQSHQDLTSANVTSMKAAITNLKYYDPSNPGTLISANFDTGTFQRKLLFKNISSQLEVRNNYQIQADVSIYLCTVKTDTNQAPSDLFTSGMADSSNTASTSVLAYPSDSKQLTQVWNVKRVYSGIMDPGQMFKMSHSVKDIMYDPQSYGEQSTVYQRQYKSFVWMVLIKGTLSHDTSINEQGLSSAGVDLKLQSSYNIEYDAGGDLFYVDTDITGLSAFTNSAVQSQKPVPDNVGYSTA